MLKKRARPFNADQVEYAGHPAFDEHSMPSTLYLGIADGMSIARVWACRYSK